MGRMDGYRAMEAELGLMRMRGCTRIEWERVLLSSSGRRRMVRVIWMEPFGKGRFGMA